MNLRQILEWPEVYQKFQEWGGFFGERTAVVFSLAKRDGEPSKQLASDCSELTL